jgi:hypothetical protein
MCWCHCFRGYLHVRGSTSLMNSQLFGYSDRHYVECLYVRVNNYGGVTNTWETDEVKGYSKYF